ncbi:MAG: alpha-L-fucosidase [Phycisphaerae bacterium]|nr:alpha-L-fucosidase [Phycisphaerae bacterium]
MLTLLRRVVPLALVSVGLVSMSGCAGTSPSAGSSGGATGSAGGAAVPGEPERLGWWSDARFGMFIHWGLYAIPAGVHGDKNTYGEWIRSEARIPVDEYDRYRTQFNPVKFDADAWCRTAKAAGMKYIVITSKHHDGFALFDSAVTDHDVMDTPFKRDILKELADASRRHGIKICWYYSIMDWHHPDYLPRRDWEKDRSTAGADYDRYVGFMKSQLKELLTNYGPIGVLWFDGQWEGTWTNERGYDLQKYVRELQPDIIINSRVGRSGGAYGLEADRAERLGDYGTPEQFIPETAPTFPWETCMTMNGHWGYNAADKNFKSADDLVRKLVDIASKGGNFLLNVGPTAEGAIPAESVERLRAVGRWTFVNGASIHGTVGSPLSAQSWGRCTAKYTEDGNTTLFLHMFDWPADGKLRVTNLLNKPLLATPLADKKPSGLAVDRDGDSLVIALPAKPAQMEPVTVVKLVVEGKPDVVTPPVVEADAGIFIDSMKARVTSGQKNVEVRYTLDGSEPTASSARATGAIAIDRSATLRARTFRDGKAMSSVVERKFEKVTPREAVKGVAAKEGLEFEFVKGDFDRVPKFESFADRARGECRGLDLSKATEPNHFAMRFTGYLDVPRDGVYTLTLGSDDGSVMTLGNGVLIDHDGLHSYEEKSATVALAKGLHPFGVSFFEKSGGYDLKLFWSTPGGKKEAVPAGAMKR